MNEGPITQLEKLQSVLTYKLEILLNFAKFFLWKENMLKRVSKSAHNKKRIVSGSSGVVV